MWDETKRANNKTMRNSIKTALAAAFMSLAATVALAQDAKLTLSPALVVTGPTDRMAIEADGSFDMAKVTPSNIAIVPDHGVRGIKVLDTAPKSVGIALDLSNNAQIGKRTVTVTIGGKTAKGELDIIQGGSVVIEAPGKASQTKGVTATLNVVSRGGVDLSAVKPADIKVEPKDVGVVEVTGQSADGLTVGLKVPPAKKNLAGTLRIGGEVKLAADFTLAGPHAAKACGKLQHCCDGEGAACKACKPIDQVCRK
jgi:hypothetical protein